MCRFTLPLDGTSMRALKILNIILEILAMALRNAWACAHASGCVNIPTLHILHIYSKKKKKGFNLLNNVFLYILLSVICNNPFGILLAHLEVVLCGKWRQPAQLSLLVGNTPFILIFTRF